VVELDGCMTEADSASEAVAQLEEARAEWITVALEQGLRIPEPLSVKKYSGKIFLRVSPQLHRRVAEMAARQGVSMSQWASELLAREVGSPAAAEPVGGKRPPA
jgi:antitoxin HicB